MVTQPPGGAAPPQQRKVVPTGASPEDAAGLRELAGRMLYLAGARSGRGGGPDPTALREAANEFKRRIAYIYRNDEPYRNYLDDYADRVLNNEPPISFGEYDQYVKQQPERSKAAHAKYDELSKSADEGRNLIGHLQISNELLKNPNLLMGPQAETTGRVLSMIRGLQDTAEAYNIPFPNLKSFTEPAAAIAAYNTLTKQIILSKLGGSLQKGVSEGDRVFGNGLTSNIADTKEGAALINAINLEFAKRQIEIGNIARDYMSSSRGGPRANTVELDRRTQEWADSHPLFRDANGNLTPAGIRIWKMIPGSQNPTVVGPDGTGYIELNGQLIPVGGR